MVTICKSHICDKSIVINTIVCRYNAVKYSMIFHTVLRWLKQNINQCQITNYSPYHWAPKMHVRNILPSMCLRWSPFYQLSVMQCMRLYVFSLPISLLMILRITLLNFVITKSEICISSRCLGLRYATMYVCYASSVIYLQPQKHWTGVCCFRYLVVVESSVWRNVWV